MFTGEHAELAMSHIAERRRMLVQLQTLNADLLSQDSATAVLQSLCDRRDPGSSRIRARKISVVDNSPDVENIRHQMGAPAGATVRHRRVDLMCGDLVLCRADNWYLPDQLTDEMNAQLLASETPFGVVVRALRFQRQTLSSALLFEPMSTGYDDCSAADWDHIAFPPEDVLQHRAMLRTREGRTFALLLETYTKQVLTT